MDYLHMRDMDTAKDNHRDPLDDTKEFLSRSAQRASVYLCYSTPDEVAAGRFCAAFESRGTPCWFAARDLTSSMVWPQCVLEAIESSKFFVFFLTEASRSAEDLIPEIVEAKACGRSILVLQSVDEILNPKLEELLTDSHVLEVDETLSDHDIEYAWAKIVEIESDSTWESETPVSLDSEADAGVTANSFLIQLDCLKGTVHGKTSCQLGVGDRLVFGRGSEADIFVDDQRASRRHAGLVLERDPKYGLELQLMDLMSRNGTWVRYRRDDDADISKFLEHSRTRIVSGAIIRIGSTDMRVTAVPIPAKVSRAAS